MRNLFVFNCLMALCVSSSASALINSVPIATDPHIKTVLYSPNEVIKYTGYYTYQSNILFGEEEQLGTISMGIVGPWQVNPLGNRLFIKPVEEDATTNMTIITNKHTYFFELHAEHAKDINDKNIPYETRIVYQNDEANGNRVGNVLDRVPDLESEDINKFNFRYTVSGSNDVTPIRIFDDGEFTYFQFHDVNGEIPAFYNVDKEGNESIINYRARGPYIVVERVAAKFTLRHGTSVVCIFNEAMSDGKPKEKKSWFSRVFGGSSDTKTTSTPSNANSNSGSNGISSWFSSGSR